MKQYLTSNEVRELLRQECAKVGSQRKWALIHHMHPYTINTILSGKRGIGLTLQNRLGLKQVFIKE